MKFTKYDCNPTTEEIISSVVENGGKLMSFGSSFCCPGECISQVGDWEIRLVDRRGCGNHGTFVAIATTVKTYEFQLAATMALLRQWADQAEKRDPEFIKNSRGNIACEVIPLFLSPLCELKKHFLGKDEKWAYFCIAHGNFLRVGDDRYRIWVDRIGRSAKR